MKKFWKRTVALLLCAVTVATPLASCTKNDPNDDERQEDPEYMKGHDQRLTYEISTDESSCEYLVRSGDTKGVSNTGLPINRNVFREGAEFSLKWERQDQKTSVSFKEFPKDITDYSRISLWIYSEKNTGSKMQLCINCQPSTQTPGKTAYKRHEITVNWTGWKRIDLKLGEFGDGYGADFSQVSSVVLNCTGWSMTANPETVIYIDSVFFNSEEYTFSMTEEEIGIYNYDHVIETLRKFLVGNIDYKDAKNENKTKLDSYIKAAKNAQSKMRRGKQTPFEADMKDSAGVTTNFNNIRNMAKGYAVKGGELYKDEKLLNDIVYAMDYMILNHYSDRNSSSVSGFNNWWDWQIGSAQAIVDTIICIRDDVSQDQIDTWLEPLNSYIYYPTLTMANRVDIAYSTVAAAALQYDYSRIAISRDALDECCIYVESGDGFYTDGSFIQHDIIAYTGSYGPIMLEALSKIILATSDTCFRFSEDMINSQYDWTIDSYTPLMYHGAFYGLVRGRSICRTSTDVSLGLTAVIGMIRMTEYLTNNDYIKTIKSILKEYYLYNGDYYRGALSPYDLSILDDIIADTSVSARTDFEFAKVFARMDRPIAQLSEYGVGISLSSSRIAKYEAINGENGKGWYTGDGMLYIYTSVNDYDPEYWKNVNYYRIPGTTVTTVPRVNQNITASNTLSKYDFVGGTALDTTMVAAMQFESAPSKIGFNSTLNGKKAWFVFDNEIVCLGSAINSSDTYNTETIIENRRLDATQLFSADGQKIDSAYGTLTDVKSLYVESFGGIYLPTDKTVSFNRTKNDVSFLELYFDHGKKVTNDTYAYVLLPTMTEAETSAYAANPEIEIIANNADYAVVHDNSSGMTGYVFWNKGTVNGVTVSAPCTVIVSDDEIAVSDPTQKLTSVTVTVDGKSYTFDDLYKGSTSVKSK